MEGSDLSLTSFQPVAECPGFRCIFGDGACKSIGERCNRVVDCLGGEDEMNCPFRLDSDNVILGQTPANNSDAVVTSPAPFDSDISTKPSAPEINPEGAPKFDNSTPNPVK